jgi:hypothetical protein
VTLNVLSRGIPAGQAWTGKGQFKVLPVFE